MDEKLKKIVKEETELILDIPEQGNPKWKILLYQAKKSLEIFENCIIKLDECGK